MKIAVQSADLDADRIDGTRVYLWQLLCRFGKLAPEEQFILYHRHAFNKQLTPPERENYVVRAIPQPLLWTQTRLSFALRKDKPDVLWMPVQSIPLLRSRSLRTVVTIHDLAFRYFPESFPRKDQFKLNFLATLAIKGADMLIAVSEHTKKDILYFYPDTDPDRIAVVHHGYDGDMFRENAGNHGALLKKLSIKQSRYILYVGAFQPRKNLVTLIRAFELLKKREEFSDVKLVLAGERAWLWEPIVEAAKKSPNAKDIVMPGKLPFSDVIGLYQNAGTFAYPSLYEGFGLPVLEGFSAGVPVVCARNSSLPEVGGDAAVYFDPQSADELAYAIRRTLIEEVFRKECIDKGHEQLKKFSWDKCAKETLEVIRGR